MDFFLPSQEVNGDESLGAFVSRRLGRAAYENLIEPLMSGIYAGDGDSLSLQATFPYLRDLEINQGGLVKGALHVRKQRLNNGRKPPPGSRSLFLTPLAGLTEIVESLVDRLEGAGVDMRLQTYVQDVNRAESGYQVVLGNGETVPPAGLILATPAFVSGDLLSNIVPSLAGELKAIEYVSTATVTLAYQESDLVRPLDGYGYVIPRRENRKALACTWTSTKFPHRAPDGFTLIRVFIGRAGQEGEISWEDENLLAIAREELNLTLGIKAEPILQRVFRWENAMPQYNIGHPARMVRIEDILQKFPGLGLAGNGYRGIGIPDCIHSGEIAAVRVLESLPVK
jgi:oxygen-dependent protoporphyrinogen oxidase